MLETAEYGNGEALTQYEEQLKQNGGLYG